MLDEVAIAESATRPVMWLGLPRTLSSMLMLVGALMFVLTSSTWWEIGELLGVAMVWFAIKPLVANDYHGFDIFFFAWTQLDLLCLDRRQWGGTPYTPYHLRNKQYRIIDAL